MGLGQRPRPQHEEPILSAGSPPPATGPAGDVPDALSAAIAASGAPPAERGPATRLASGLLTAVVPGLGHLVIGRRRAAAVFAAPIVGLLAAIAALDLTQPRTDLLALLVDPTVIGFLLVLQVVLLGWRLAAVTSVMGDRSFGRAGAVDRIAFALVLALVVLPQAAIGYATDVAREASARAFAPSIDEAFPSASPGAAIASPGPGHTDAAPSPAAGSRMTVLLLGMDSGVGRTTALTDTMIVASLDPVAGTVSMVSVPRDLVDAPLPAGGAFSPKVNGLVSYVARNPAEFPGYKGHGQAVLAWSLGKMLGVHIDYYAQVNLAGFARVVDALGGVDINVDHAICDAGYREYGVTGFSIGAGRHHLNGDVSLAYARIRKAAGESDFTRAARQQQIIVAIKDRIISGGFLDDPIGLFQALGDTIQTNIPPARIRDLAPLAAQIRPSDIYKTVINHPFVRAGFDVRGSIQLPDLPAIRALGASLFTPVGTRPLVTYVTPSPTIVAQGPPRPAPGCTVLRPAATPRPSPTPVPSVSATASTLPSAPGSAGASGTPTEGPTAAPTSTALPTASPAGPTALPSPAPTS